MLAFCENTKCQLVTIWVKPLNRCRKQETGVIGFLDRSTFMTLYFTLCSDDQWLGTVRDFSSYTASNQKGHSFHGMQDCICTRAAELRQMLWNFRKLWSCLMVAGKQHISKMKQSLNRRWDKQNQQQIYRYSKEYHCSGNLFSWLRLAKGGLEWTLKAHTMPQCWENQSTSNEWNLIHFKLVKKFSLWLSAYKIYNLSYAHEASKECLTANDTANLSKILSHLNYYT